MVKKVDQIFYLQKSQFQFCNPDKHTRENKLIAVEDKNSNKIIKAIIKISKEKNSIVQGNKEIGFC